MTKEDFLQSKREAREQRAHQKRFEHAVVHVQSLARTKLVKLGLKRKFEAVFIDKNATETELHSALIDYMRLVVLDGFLKCKLKSLKPKNGEERKW